MMIDETLTTQGEETAQETRDERDESLQTNSMAMPSDQPANDDSQTPSSAIVEEIGNTPEQPEAAEPAPTTAIATEERPQEPSSNAIVEELSSEPEAPAAVEPPAAVVEERREEPPAQPEVGRDMSDDARLFEAAMGALESGEDQNEGGYKKLSKGDRVEATVIQVDRDKVFVDLGTKSEGIVPIGELTDENIESAMGHVKVGDKINVVVLRAESAEGNPVVSKRRADFEDAWDHIEEAFNAGTFITAQVVDRVKGGLVVDIGVRGFVPATHVGNGKLRNIEKYVGQPLQLKIIEIDRERKKVVLSNRQAEEERRGRAKDDLFETVNPGDTLEGQVRRLTDYGAFVDLGGVDGLLHISEMSWMRITHPREMFKEGQKIKVMVLRLDKENGKISLGHRQVMPDPWNLIKETYTVGQKLQTKISRMVVSGAFVKLPEGAEGFIPLSEMSMRRLRRPEDAVEEGQDVEVQIIDLRPDERRMVLSMRATGNLDYGRPQTGSGGGAPSYDDDDRKRGGPGGKKAGGKKTGGKPGGGGRGRGGEDDEFEEIVGRRGFATGGATIGERLGMLKGFLRDEDEDLEEPTEPTEDGDVIEASAANAETPAPEAAEAPATEEPVEPAESAEEEEQKD